MKKQQIESDKIDRQHRKILKRFPKKATKKTVKQMVKEYEENII